MKYKIAVDSSGEFPEAWKNDPRYESIPLTLTVEGEDIIDDETFDQADFLAKVAASPNCPKSACPSPERYMQAFSADADHIYGVTLSSELSGSYNSAMLGRNLALEDYPDKKIHVFNSKSASIAETLVAIKITECEEAGLPFEETVEVVEKYIDECMTLFVLETLETLRKNGRLSNLKAFVATALKIKPLMGADKEGKIIQIDQARGMNKALVKMVNYIEENIPDTQNRILAISHCNSPSKAKMLRDALLERMKFKDILFLDTRGLSSMYACDGGIILTV